MSSPTQNQRVYWRQLGGFEWKLSYAVTLVGGLLRMANSEAGTTGAIVDPAEIEWKDAAQQ